MQVILFAAAALLLAAPVRAEWFKVDDVHLDLKFPPGHCLFERGRPYDDTFLAGLRQVNDGQNTVIAIAGECRQLALARAGTGDMFDYSIWLLIAPKNVPKVVPPGTTRERFVSEMAARMPKLDIADIMRKQSDRFASVGVEVSVQSSGVVKTTSSALYVGFLMNTRAGQGLSTQMAGITAFGAFGQHAVTFNTYRLADDPKVLNVLLARSEDVYARTYAANIGRVVTTPVAQPLPGMSVPQQPTLTPPAQPQQAQYTPQGTDRGINWPRIAGRAIAGAILAGLVALVFGFFKRKGDKKPPPL